MDLIDNIIKIIQVLVIENIQMIKNQKIKIIDLGALKKKKSLIKMKKKISKNLYFITVKFKVLKIL